MSSPSPSSSSLIEELVSYESAVVRRLRGWLNPSVHSQATHAAAEATASETSRLAAVEEGDHSSLEKESVTMRAKIHLLDAVYSAVSDDSTIETPLQDAMRDTATNVRDITASLSAYRSASMLNVDQDDFVANSSPLSSPSGIMPANRSSTPKPKSQGHAQKKRRPQPSFVLRMFPIILWLRTYSWRHTFRKDFVAGLTVGSLLVPQSMAYALLAGLSPITGLYSSFLPLILYALCGTSRQLAVGPVAIVSLLSAESVRALLPSKHDSDDFHALAALLALFAGVFQMLFGALKLGVVVMNVLSHPVVSGFTSAAAISIGLSQCKYLLGVKTPNRNSAVLMIYDLFVRLPEAHWEPFVMGVVAMTILYLIRRYKRTLPGPLIVVILGTFLTWICKLPVSTVGHVPAGLPTPAIPLVMDIDINRLVELIPASLTIAFVGFIESISIATSLASKSGHTVDANQELIALGASDVVSGLFRGYAVTGGFSRTAANANAGAQTQIASCITALFIMLTMLVLTSLFYYLPYAVLAAIVIIAVSQLVDFHEAKFCYRTSRVDFVVLSLAFWTTILIGVDIGVFIGLGASVMVVIQRSASPRIAEIARIKGSTVYVERYRVSNDGTGMDSRFEDETRAKTGVCVARISSDLFFVNAKHVLEEIMHDVKDDSARGLVVDMGDVHDIDSSALLAVRELMTNVKKRFGCRTWFAHVNERLVFALTQSKLFDEHELKDLCEAGDVYVAVRVAREWVAGKSDSPPSPQQQQQRQQQTVVRMPLEPSSPSMAADNDAHQNATPVREDEPLCPPQDGSHGRNKSY